MKERKVVPAGKGTDRRPGLSWEERIRILTEVARRARLRAECNKGKKIKQVRGHGKEGQG